MGLLNLVQQGSFHDPHGFSINIAPWIWPNHHTNWDSGRKSNGRCGYTTAEGVPFLLQWRMGVERWGGNVSELFAQDVTICTVILELRGNSSNTRQ